MSSNTRMLEGIAKGCVGLVCSARSLQIGGAALSLLAIKECSYRSLGPYGLVNGLLEQPARPLASPEWRQMVGAIRDCYITGSDYAKDAVHETAAAEALLRRVVVNLRTLETRSGGLDDVFTSMEDLPAVGERLGSFGPLQIQPGVAVATYVRHHEQLKELDIFRVGGRSAPAPQEVRDLLRAGDKAAILKILDVRGYGGILLGVCHYLDLYQDIRISSEQVLRDPVFVARCAARDSSLGPGRKYSSTSAILSAQLRDSDSPLSGRYVAQMAMTAFNAGQTAMTNAAGQCLLNEMAVLCGESPSIVCDGAFGKNTLTRYAALLQKLNLQHDTLIAENGLENEKLSPVQVRQHVLRSIWFGRGLAGTETFEDRFASYLRAIIELSSSWDVGDQRQAHKAIQRIFLGDGDLNMARGSAFLAIRDTFATWLPERENLSSREIATRERLQREWLRFLDDRDPAFLDNLDPQIFAARFATDVKGYGKFCRLLVHRLSSYQCFGLYGEYPSLFRANILKGKVDPFERAYLGRQLEQGVPRGKLKRA